MLVDAVEEGIADVHDRRLGDLIAGRLDQTAVRFRWGIDFVAPEPSSSMSCIFLPPRCPWCDASPIRQRPFYFRSEQRRYARRPCGFRASHSCSADFRPVVGRRGGVLPHVWFCAEAETAPPLPALWGAWARASPRRAAA